MTDSVTPDHEHQTTHQLQTTQPVKTSQSTHNIGGTQTSMLAKYVWVTAVLAEMRWLGSYVSIFYQTQKHNITLHTLRNIHSRANTLNKHLFSINFQSSHGWTITVKNSNINSAINVCCYQHKQHTCFIEIKYVRQYWSPCSSHSSSLISFQSLNNSTSLDYVACKWWVTKQREMYRKENFLNISSSKHNSDKIIKPEIFQVTKTQLSF